ncbi:MAG: hypothetical protein IT236_14910 [Bacteroidia bacterium]|nr:hypothetical protein [Bacteroidia bacterium]
MKLNKEKYVDAIISFAKLLNKASHWEHSKQTVGFIERANNDHYLYEFYCYIRIVSDLTANYTVKYVSGKGKYPDKFPQAAAKKRLVPRFEIYDKKTDKKLFQICTGTKVKSVHDFYNVHPDISFQKAHAGDEPENSDLLMVMDAKFKRQPDKRLPFDEITSFCELVNGIYGLQKKKLPELKFHRLKDILGNALLTNALAHNDNDTYISGRNIKEIEAFDVGKIYRVKGGKRKVSAKIAKLPSDSRL